LFESHVFNLMRAQLKLWSEVLQSVVEDTKGHVEKKQASTYEEILAEQEQKAEEVRRLCEHLHLCYSMPCYRHPALCSGKSDDVGGEGVAKAGACSSCHAAALEEMQI
jgi:hypothetical protein